MVTCFRSVPLAPVLRLLDCVSMDRRMDFEPELAVRLVWMGVPVVCLEGASYAGRQGAAIANAIGFEKLTAKSIDEYVEIAVRWASDLEQLRKIRRDSRERLKPSVLCDAVRFTRNLEAAYREMVRSV